jgi:hypothetical protein
MKSLRSVLVAAAIQAAAACGESVSLAEVERKFPARSDSFKARIAQMQQRKTNAQQQRSANRKYNAMRRGY